MSSYTARGRDSRWVETAGATCPHSLQLVSLQRMGTVHGEELPYFFGAPLVDGFNHFPRNYTRSELALAEAVIIYVANFARTG